MKKISSNKSAFFNLRALLAFAFSFLGIALAIFAQGLSNNGSAPGYAGPPNDHRPVNAIRSRPLREIHPIHPAMAPGHDHPEPIRPTPPSQSRGPDRGPHTSPGALLCAPTPPPTPL